jgi:hypothetical protein
MDRTRDINDILLDAVIKEAVYNNFYAKMNALPTEEEARKLYPPSPEHVRKMKKLFAWEKRRNLTRKMLVHAKAAVLVLCVATAVFFSALMFNPQVRAAVHGAIVQFFELFARVEFTEPQDTDREAGSFVLEYIPDEYKQINFEEYGESAMTIYINENGDMIIFNVLLPDMSSVDIELRDYRLEIYNGIDYHIFEAHSTDDYSYVVWETGGFMFNLTGVVSVDILLEMALSVK